jgi:hypothetical protein
MRLANQWIAGGRGVATEATALRTSWCHREEGRGDYKMRVYVKLRGTLAEEIGSIQIGPGIIRSHLVPRPGQMIATRSKRGSVPPKGVHTVLGGSTWRWPRVCTRDAVPARARPP